MQSPLQALLVASSSRKVVSQWRGLWAATTWTWVDGQPRGRATPPLNPRV